MVLRKLSWPIKPRWGLVEVITGSWLVLWLGLFARSFFKDRSYWKTSIQLAHSNAEERSAMTYGPDLYEFFRFCTEHIPENSEYQLVGLSMDSLDRVRLVYLLYPRILSEQPGFIIVYRAPDFEKGNMKMVASFDAASYVLDARVRGPSP